MPIVSLSVGTVLALMLRGGVLGKIMYLRKEPKFNFGHEAAFALLFFFTLFGKDSRAVECKKTLALFSPNYKLYGLQNPEIPPAVLELADAVGFEFSSLPTGTDFGGAVASPDFSRILVISNKTGLGIPINQHAVWSPGRKKPVILEGDFSLSQHLYNYRPKAVAFSSDSSSIIALSNNQVVGWNSSTGEVQHLSHESTREKTDLWHISPNGMLVSSIDKYPAPKLSGHENRERGHAKVSVHASLDPALEKIKFFRNLENVELETLQVEFLTDDILAIYNHDFIRLERVSTGKTLLESTYPYRFYRTPEISRDESKLFVTHRDYWTLYDLTGRREPKRFEQNVKEGVFLSGGKRIAICMDDEIQIWDVDRWTIVSKIRLASTATKGKVFFQSIAAGTNQNLLFTQLGDRIVAWDPATVEPLFELSVNHLSNVIHATGPDSIMWYGTVDGHASIWLGPFQYSSVGNTSKYRSRSQDGTYTYESSRVNGIPETIIK